MAGFWARVKADIKMAAKDKRFWAVAVLALVVVFLLLVSTCGAQLATTDPYQYQETVAWLPGDRVLDLQLATSLKFRPAVIVAYSASDWGMQVLPSTGAADDTLFSALSQHWVPGTAAAEDTLIAALSQHWVPSSGKVYRGGFRYLVGDSLVTRADTVWVDCYRLR